MKEGADPSYADCDMLGFRYILALFALLALLVQKYIYCDMLGFRHMLTFLDLLVQKFRY